MATKLKDKTLHIRGEVLARRPPVNLYRDEKTGHQFIMVGSMPKNVSDVTYIQSMRIVTKYEPDVETWPEFAVEAKA